MKRKEDKLIYSGKTNKEEKCNEKTDFNRMK